MSQRSTKSGGKEEPVRGLDELKVTPAIVNKKSVFPEISVWTVFSIAILCIQLLCAIIISQYDGSHSVASSLGKSRLICVKPIGGSIQGAPQSKLSILLDGTQNTAFSPVNAALCSLDLPVPNFAYDPSVSTFVNAVMIYGFSVLFFSDIQEDDRYQNYFVASGALVGIAIGSWTAWSDSPLDALKDYIPISITAALGLSLAWHGLKLWLSPLEKSEPQLS